MTRSLPLLAILLFLLLLNLVHSLENRTSCNRKKNSSGAPLLVAREDYSSFNRTDSPVAQHKTKSQEPRPTKSLSSSDQPSVTTVIIIQSNGQTYHELGGGPSATNGGGNGPNGNGMNDPNESNIEAEVDHENEVVKRMISISTVVGGVGVVMIIAGAVIFIRLRAKRRRLKAINRYSTTSSHLHDSRDDNDTNTNTNTNHYQHHRRHFSTTSNSTHFSQHHHQQSSPISPISPSIPNSPTTTTSSMPHESIEMSTMSTIHPSAPPEPTILPLHLRQRNRQNLLSQQQVPPIVLPSHHHLISTPPAPSAPSAKELEMNLPSSSSVPTTTNPVTHPTIEVSSPTSPTTSKQNSHPLDTTHTSSSAAATTTTTTLLKSSITATGQSTSASSLSSSSQPPQSSSRTGPCLHLKPTAGSDGSDHQPSEDHQQQQPRPPLTPDMPPPAYTPSAPPLFILPPSQRRRSADQLSLDRYR